MTPSHLLALYERVAEAPDAVTRVRRLILGLAVRGKLVEPDPNDEPASELLKRIAAEKARLVKTRKIKKPKQLLPIEEAHFDLPLNWQWTRIRNVTSDRGQKIPDDTFTYIDVTAINKESGVVADPKVLTRDEAPSRARKIVAKGDVIYSCVRPYLLNVAVLDRDFDAPPIASTAFAILNGHGLVLPWYLWIVMRSPFMVANVEQNQRGQAYPAINDKDFAQLPFPLPPLAEQRRIVAKVEELMALLDRLEAARTTRDVSRDRLTAASLARLTAPETTAEAFPGHARFALDTLPALTARPEQIKALRQTILNLAVRGKLVEQDPNDVPASELLNRLASETNLTILSRTRLRSLEAPGAPFTCPAGWTWAQVWQVLHPNRDISYGVIKLGHEPKSGGVPTLRCSDVRAGFIDLSNVRNIEESIEFNYARTRLEGGEIVINIRGTLGGVALVSEKLKGFNVAREVAVIPIANDFFGPFLVYLMLSPYFWEHIKSNLRGIAYKGLNLGILRNLPLPLPPVAEQRRIVAKVDKLMVLCDRLEAALASADTTRARLLDALLREALAPSTAREQSSAGRTPPLLCQCDLAGTTARGCLASIT